MAQDVPDDEAQLASQIFSAWQLGPVVDAERSRSVTFIRDRTGARYVLKSRGATDQFRAGRIAFCADVLDHLRDVGVPVQYLLRTEDGGPSTTWHGELFTLSPYLEGGLVSHDWGVRLRFSRSVGRALGELHEALSSVQVGSLMDRTWREHPATDVGARLTTAAAHWPDAIRLGWLAAELEGLSEQLINRDCHFANLLAIDDEFAGFVDCDHFAIGPRLFDLAYYLVSLIRFEPFDEAVLAYLLDLVRTTATAYIERAPLPAGEIGKLPSVMLYIPLLMITFCEAQGEPQHLAHEVRLLQWLTDHLEDIRAVTPAPLPSPGC